MVCKVGRQLAEDFALAARQYADTVARLGRLSAQGLDPAQLLLEEEETLRLADVALHKAEDARGAIAAHLNQHRYFPARSTEEGCEDSSSAA